MGMRGRNEYTLGQNAKNANLTKF